MTRRSGLLCSLSFLPMAFSADAPPSGVGVGFQLEKDWGAAFLQGPKGKIMRGFKSDIPDLDAKLKELPNPEPQVTNFVEAVKTRKKFALNEVNGHRSCTLINLAKIALQTGRVLHFDPKTQRFIKDDEANSYVSQPMRAPWKI